MSVRKRKAGLVISWQRSFSILAPWRKGKADRDAVLDGKVVLTKMKLLGNFHEKLLTSDDSASTVSTVSHFDKDASDPSTAPREDSHCEAGGRPGAESGPRYLSAIFSNSQLPRLYKFESEDSGVELPSGANSPSTPTGSEQSFVVHSRESSFASGQGPPDPDSLPEQPDPLTQTQDSVRNRLSPTADDHSDVFAPSSGFSSLSVEAQRGVGENVDQSRPPGPGGPWGTSQSYSESSRSGNRRCQETYQTTMNADCVRTRAAGSLEEYMEECCRLSEAQRAGFNPLGSGLGYLEHICQLIEKIGQLQDNNLRLQRHICSLQKNGRMTKTKESFFQQHCSCGAASLAFQDVPRPSPSECVSPSGTLSDLSTIPEVSRRPLTGPRTDVDGEGLNVVPRWRTSLKRSSYTEGEVGFLGSSMEGLPVPTSRLGENYTLGRFRDVVRKTRMRNQSRLGLLPSPLKMSCPQLYRPDLGAEASGRNRNSLISLGNHSRLDFSFPQ